MNSIWFEKPGLLYIPLHVLGYIITVLAIIFLVAAYMAIIRSGHSVDDDFYHIFSLHNLHGLLVDMDCE